MNWEQTKTRLFELTGIELGEAGPHGANLREANLSGMDLSGADLRGANLRWADLGGADLGGANLSEADLRGANLGRANLSEANLGGADLAEAYLGGANLQFTNVFACAAGKHPVYYVPWQRRLKIGCIEKTLEWWLENYAEAGRKNKYTEADIARYGAIIQMIAGLYPVDFIGGDTDDDAEAAALRDYDETVRDFVAGTGRV